MPYKIVDYMKEKELDSEKAIKLIEKALAVVSEKPSEEEEEEESEETPAEEPEKEPESENEEPTEQSSDSDSEILKKIEKRLTSLEKRIKRREHSEGTVQDKPHEEHKIERNKFEVII